MDPRMIPRGSGPEYNYDENTGGAARPNEPGVYFHPQAQKFIETAGIKRPDGSIAYSVDSGRVQGDAFVQLGYRPASDEELKEYRAQQAAKAEEKRKRESATTISMSSDARK